MPLLSSYMVQSVRNFVSKEDFDFDGPDITLQKFHPQLELFFALNGIFFNNRESKIRFIWPVLSILMALTGTGLEMMFVFHGVSTKDYFFATECLIYVVILVSASIVGISVLGNRNKIFTLLKNINGDFLFICSLDSKYRDPFLKGQCLIWKLCWSWNIFCIFIVVLYISNTFIHMLYMSTLATQDEHMIRPLIFPMWLPEDDPYRTPNYEIFMFIQLALIFIVLLTFGVYVYILFHLLLHYYNLMDIIMIAFDELFDGLDESAAALPPEHPRRKTVQAELNRRMGQIVRWHISIFDAVEKVSSVYGPTLVYQVMVSSVLICLVAYQVAEQLAAGKFDYLFAMLGISACLQLWIPCYIGTLLQSKGFLLGDHCFYCGWHATQLGRLLRKDIVLFILRTQQPVSIKFTGLPHLQLETFSSIMSTAYTYFNMLRQYN